LTQSWAGHRYSFLIIKSTINEVEKAIERGRGKDERFLAVLKKGVAYCKENKKISREEGTRLKSNGELLEDGLLTRTGNGARREDESGELLLKPRSAIAGRRRRARGRGEGGPFKNQRLDPEKKIRRACNIDIAQKKGQVERRRGKVWDMSIRTI